MRKNLGNNEASGFRTKSGAIMIVSILTVVLFIGTALQPAIASPNLEVGFEVEEREDECTLCRPRERPLIDDPDPLCKTCLCVVGVAVDYGIRYTRNNIIEHISENAGQLYDGLLGDIVLWLIEGIGEGIIKSGFKIELDKKELNETINYYVNKYVGPQGHNLTKILVALRAISIGIRVYLISLCADGKHILPITARLMQFFSEIIAEIIINILLLPVK